MLKQTVADQPILPQLASHFDEDTIRQAIHSTTAIESNPLSKEQVGTIMASPQEARSTVQAKKEITNLRRSLHLVPVATERIIHAE